MAIITFANTKGGAGKTTAVAIVACELIRMGFSVKVLDADPQLWFSKWYEKMGANAPKRLSVVSYVTGASLNGHIERAQGEADFVLLDLPGARSPLIAQAVGQSQYVIIPIQGSAMDAEGGANVIELIQYLADRANIRIPHSVVLTRINPMVTTRSLQTVKDLRRRSSSAPPIATSSPRAKRSTRLILTASRTSTRHRRMRRRWGWKFCDAFSPTRPSR
jgi:chromosome partitioning protein